MESAAIMRTKILFIRTDAGVCDPRILKESSSLKKAGYDVRVFGWDRKKEYPRNEIVNSVYYYRSRIPAPYGSKVLAFVLPFFWVRAMIALFSERPDVVHACDLDAYIPAILLRPFLRYKLVYDIFDTFADKVTGLPMFVRQILTIFDRGCRRRADVVIVTDTTRRKQIEGERLKRIEVIMNTPPHMSTTPVPGKRSHFQVCYAGSIHEHRGLRQIAKAVSDLENVQTILAGWIPRSIDAEFLESQPQLEYLGRLRYEESLGLIGRSDVVLALYDPSLPINAMASSNKVFEAMSARRPVITNRETTMAPIVHEENCGILVAYGDIKELRDAIVELRDNSSLRDSLGENGYNAFLKKYNWNLMERRLCSLYAEICGMPTPERKETIGAT
jgi:glycosyltransferase involved in cell wall biosynthesis